MKTALLHNDNIITAPEYDPSKHGSRIYCIDKACKAPVIFIPQTKTASPHFKTTGKEGSQHKRDCGFFQPLDCSQAIRKVKEYQEELLEKGLRETIIRLDMKKIDPDYEPKKVDRDSEKKKDEDEEVKTKNDQKKVSSISSVKSVLKLITSYEPDILASVMFNIGGGRRVPLSSLVVDQVEAHKLLWSDNLLHNVGYFVHGTIEKVTRLDKVWFINFFEEDDTSFTLVVFDKYFSSFTLKDSDLLNQEVLVYGMLRKNDYNNSQKTEMLIKSNKYIEMV